MPTSREKLSPKASTYHHGDLQKTLLATAAEMITQTGIESISMRKLAEQVGVSRTALYHHFEGKEALLRALAEEGFTQQRELLQSVMAASSHLPARDMLRAYVGAYIDFAVKNPAYYGLMFGSEIWQSVESNDRITEVGRRAFKSYVDTISYWQSKNIINTALDPLRFAQVSWSTLHGLSRLLIDGIYIDQVPQKATIDTVVDLFIK